MKENILTNGKDILINLLRKKFDNKLNELESRTNYQIYLINQTNNMVNSITNTCIELEKNLNEKEKEKEKEKEEIKNKKRHTLNIPINHNNKDSLLSKNYKVNSNKNSIINKTQLKNEKNEKLKKSKSNGNLLLIHNSKINIKKNKNPIIKINNNSKSSINHLNSSINSINNSHQFGLKRSKTERQLTKNSTNHSIIKKNQKTKNLNNNLSVNKDKINQNNSNSHYHNSEILSKTYDENRLLTMESSIQSGFFFNDNDPLLISPITEMDFVGKNNLLLNSNEIEDNYHLKNINFNINDFLKNHLKIILKFLNIRDYSNLKLVNKLFNSNVNETILFKLKEEKLKYENKINPSKKEKNLISNEKILKLNLSKTALKALNLLNQPLLNRLFTDSNKIPSDDILLIYHIYFQLINHPLSKEFENKKYFWEKCCNYFTKESNGKTGDILIKNAKENLNLSGENIYKIIHIIDKKVNIISPGYFSKTCSTTSLFIFFIKDILDFLGITNNRKICDNSLWTWETMVNVIDKKIDKINIYCKHFV